MPDLPARQLSQNSLTELPMGVIAPMPVTTTRVLPFLPFLPFRPAMLTSVLSRLAYVLIPKHVRPRLGRNEERACYTY